MPMQVLSKRPYCLFFLCNKRAHPVAREGYSEQVSPGHLKDGNFSALRTFHKLFDI